MLGLFFFYSSKDLPSVYYLTTVTSSNDVPKTGRKIKMNGISGGITCFVPEKPEVPEYFGDPSDLLQSISNTCLKFLKDDEALTYCIDGEVKLGEISLGFIDDYKWSNGNLSSQTYRGSLCPNGSHFKFFSKYECDNSIETPFTIPSFWKVDNCSYAGVVKTRSICKHVDLGKEKVYNVKCVPNILIQLMSHMRPSH